MAPRRQESEMFAEERKAIQAARKEIQASKHADNELREGYERLLLRYDKFLRETNKILNISDSQSLALIRMDTELKSLLNNAGQGFMMIDHTLKVQKHVSSECKRILGRKIAGQAFTELLWPDDEDIRATVERVLLMMLTEADASIVQAVASSLPDSFEKNGLLVRIEYKKIVSKDGIDDPRIMIILTDRTDHHHSRERLEFLSTHDSLTGLFNRNYIDRWLAEHRKQFPIPFSLIMTDMNGLKLVNDVFGHMVGDELLVRSAGLLRDCFGEDAICARWGGDEFLILLPDTDSTACAGKVQQVNEACEATQPNPIKISMAIGTVTLTSPDQDYAQMFLQAEKEMYKKKLIESRNVRKKLIQDISDTMYSSGIEDPGHIDRVTEMATGLAEQLGIVKGSSAMSMLTLLARLHDVGKIAIPKEVFSHGEELTSYQWDVMRTHSEVGYRLAFSLGEPALAEAILSMHERWDGRGYPYGLQREQIPELSRLLALVDAFDTMTNEQVYRKTLSKEEAIMEIMGNSGTQFDPLVVEVFVRWMEQNSRS